MGMFDTVIARCPRCCAEVVFQSKAGPCALETFTLDEVPREVAVDVMQDMEWCSTCDTPVRLLELPPDTKTVRLIAVKA